MGLEGVTMSSLWGLCMYHKATWSARVNAMKGGWQSAKHVGASFIKVITLGVSA